MAWPGMAWAVVVAIERAFVLQVDREYTALDVLFFAPCSGAELFARSLLTERLKESLFVDRCLVDIPNSLSRSRSFIINRMLSVLLQVKLNFSVSTSHTTYVNSPSGPRHVPTIY